MALAPSSSMLLSVVVPGQCCHSLCCTDRRRGVSRREKGAEGLTAQTQLLKCLIERPGAIGVHAGLQGRGDGLG